ncbi:MAG: Clostripain family protein, partial [Firmicutes bacterium]|nr:Clostripain family protein [Bacillota bacterium]
EPVDHLEISVSSDTGKMTVARPAYSSSNYTGDTGVWTILVYMCGSDLESEGANATYDLIEMLDGSASDDLRFVIQTGGTYQWQNELVKAGRLQRYVITDGDIDLVDEKRNASMGDEECLTDFLSWGLENYPSEYMGLIFWNHGGGSITGVCFDETDDYESINLRELDSALNTVCKDTGRKFDFIGFDACLMCTLETANILASYADFMFASEEIEPGRGWDYEAIGEFIYNNPAAKPLYLGKAICDSFYEAGKKIGYENICTLAVTDLSKINDLVICFNDFSKGLYDAASDTATCSEMIRNIYGADNFGGNNKSEGYTNMVDLKGLVSACEGFAEGAEKTLSALNAAVVYSVSGRAHKDASGLSLYYPLSVQGSKELSVFGDICPSPYYLSFVDRQSQGSISPQSAQSYSDSTWFDNGNWNFGIDLSDWNSWYGNYWNYLDSYEPTGDSSLITFEIPPHLDSDGDFWFQFDDNGYNYAADVYGLVYQLADEEDDIIELGETYDLRGGWDSGVFMDDFDGYWLSLPDGQNLATYIVGITDDEIIYTSPITLNGEDMHLRLRQDWYDGSVVIEGAWYGLSDNGAASREMIKLQEGDVIVPQYFAFGIYDDEDYIYEGWEYVIKGTPEINYDIMDDGDYMFCFEIDDIYGDYYLSDYAFFSMEDGDVIFYED